LEVVMDRKKYYYIKLKDNYFDQYNIRILESMKNGHTYSLILIKLYLKASKYDGKLMMTPSIPYDPNRVEILANVIGHDIDHVKQAIRAGVDLDLVTILESGEIWMNEIQNLIGQSSTEADRIREYRNSLKQKCLPDDNNDNVQMYNKSTPEIEKELEIKIEKDREKEYCSDLKNNVETVIELPMIGSVSNPLLVHRVTKDDVIQYKEVYPSVNVDRELKKMRLWLDSNPTKRKKNIKSFIARWLAKAQDNPKKEKKTYEEIYEECKERYGDEK
jgi:predicted phage replisome organizer